MRTHPRTHWLAEIDRRQTLHTLDPFRAFQTPRDKGLSDEDAEHKSKDTTGID